MPQNIKEIKYFVQGMHCASCEIIIEKELLKIKGVKSVEACTAQGTVLIEHEGTKPTVAALNKIFKERSYAFFEQPTQQEEKNKIFPSLLVAGAVIVAFLLINKLGLGSILNLNTHSSLPLFFLFGALAGLSSCAALVGGIILSMSKQWLGLYQKNGSTASQKMKPHLLFQAGRLIAYGFLGALLGAIGAKLQLSPHFNSSLVIAVSIIMVLLALQMLGVQALRKFQITAPKFITRRLADESKFQGRYMPFLIGAFTFFLPCGFTITAQGLALLSGNFWQGGLIMFLFALGTAPMLLAIGMSSVKFSTKPHLAERFLKAAGILVLFFALFNINSQLNVLGLYSFSDLNNQVSANNDIVNQDNDLVKIVAGKQLIQMEASSDGYNPNFFKVRANVLVRWEITDTGTSGCTNAIISQSLFNGQIDLTPGKTSIKEFTPTKAGRYKFSCWMGMVSGVIEVVDQTQASSDSSAVDDSNTAPSFRSGASGCGCGKN